MLLPALCVAEKPHFKAQYGAFGIEQQYPKIKVYQYIDQQGQAHFSNVPPENQSYQTLLYSCADCVVPSGAAQKEVQAKYNAVIESAAQRYQLDSALIRAVIHVESSFNAQAVSRVGAMGLMQLMPSTAKSLGVEDAFLPKENIMAGSAYLAQLLKQFDGDLVLALAAYNAGPSRVEQYQGVPPFPETQAYVEKVQRLYSQYQ